MDEAVTGDAFVRVLLIAFDSGELSIRLASALAEEVDQLCLMLPEKQAAPHLTLLNKKVNFQPFHRPRLRQFIPQIRLMYALLRRIRRFDPQVIHYQKGHFWFNLCLPLLRRYPLVVSIHDPKIHSGDKSTARTPQAILNLAYRQADRVIAHNPQMKQEIIAELGIPQDKIHITPLIERGRPELQTNEVQEDKHLVMYFGRIWKYKGLEYFIRSQPLVSAEIPEVRFLIAGRGDNFEPYRNLMADPDKFIVHNEFVTYEKQTELFRRASIVVLPYIEATQSGVIPVAYNFEKPVIATAVGGLPSQVEHECTGLLVPARDEYALADAIIRLLKNDLLRRQYGRNGRQKLEREWTASAVARQTLPVYESAIEAFTRKPERRRFDASIQ